MRFGDYLRSKREAHGWTQPQAAARIEIEQSYLSKLETGKSWPSDDVFPRLVAAYEIDVADLVQKVSSSELAKLREIADVRAAILDRDRSRRSLSRGWLLAMLACLVLGGASLGLVQLARDHSVFAYSYESKGVLTPEEPLDAFRLVEITLEPGQPDYEDLRRRQQDLINRLDIVTETAEASRGVWYVDKTPEGLRVFEARETREIVVPSPLRWFIVPALAFLIASLGCGFIATRWS